MAVFDSWNEKKKKALRKRIDTGTGDTLSVFLKLAEFLQKSEQQTHRELE